MTIWDVVKLYFLIGVITIAVEWLLLIYGKRGVLYECHEPAGIKAFIVVCVFLGEIVIWPRQVLYNLWLFTKIVFGKCNQRDLEALEYEGSIADFASRNKKEEGKRENELTNQDPDNCLCEMCRNPKKDGIEAKRILIRMDPLKEGIIELRPGVPDISLGNRKYAQVRIFIEKSENFIKGMAIYSDDIPDDYDLVFYTRLTSKGTFAGYGKGKQDEKQEGIVIIENEKQLLAWDNFMDSLRKVKEQGDTSNGSKDGREPEGTADSEHRE